MTVLRTETTPITIPAIAWNRMKTLQSMMVTTSLILMILLPWYLYLAHGIDIIHGEVHQWDSSGAIPISLGVALIALAIMTAVSKLKENLLRKHGWDGKSPYRIELEYQTFLHD